MDAENITGMTEQRSHVTRMVITSSQRPLGITAPIAIQATFSLHAPCDYSQLDGAILRL